MSEQDDSVWFDEFWEALPESVIDLSDDSSSGENAARLVRLWGEAFRGELVFRDGDDIIGRSDGGSANRLRLTVDDQALIRRIEDAAARATQRANDGV